MMKIFRTKHELQRFIETCKEKDASIGFVPTMGALHSGHLSLVEASKKIAASTVASIFVNPTQFNDKNDFSRYPRTEEKDLQMLINAGVDAVFIPETSEMYPADDALLSFDFKGLDNRFEGAHRPGHFRGVVTIVEKLFRLVEPDFVLMGEKDFQQLAIVKLLAKTFFPKIEVIGCPTIREENGLAKSSRNMLLSETEKSRAAQIFRTLNETKSMWGTATLSAITRHVENTLGAEPFTLEYFAIVDAESLEPLEKYGDKPAVALTALRLGTVRLIDNLRI